MKGDSYASPDVPKLLQVLSHLTYYCERSVWNDIIILIHNEKKKGFFKFLCGVREVHVGLSDNYSFSKIDIFFSPRVVEKESISGDVAQGSQKLI